MFGKALLCTLALCLLAGGAAAQTITVPERIDVGCGFALPNATTALTSRYFGGDAAAFRAHVTAMVDRMKASCPSVAGAAIDPQRDVLHLLWVDADALRSTDVVHHVVLHKGSNDLFGTTLPGVTGADRVFEIFLSPRVKDAVASAYTSTQTRDPLEAQLPAFAEAIAGPLTILLASTQGALRSRGIAPPPPGAVPPTHFATVSRIRLPFARANVRVDVRVAIAPDATGIVAEAARLSTRNAFSTAAHATCAQTLNTRLKSAVDGAAVSCAADPAGCVETLAEAFNGNYRSTAPTCANAAEQKDLLAVDESYRELVTGLMAAKLSVAFDLKNTPKRLASLGLVAAYAFRGGIVDAARVKVKDGILVADPLDRRLSLVVVNLGFKPYDEGAFHPTLAERLRWFVGAVVTPDFGVAAGVSAGIVRGLTVNFGGAILGVRGLQSDDELGKPPSHDEDPFRLAQARVLFLGAGYTFK
jgi:hypothetical protein